jgi:excisionase family DNA binding protein
VKRKNQYQSSMEKARTRVEPATMSVHEAAVYTGIGAVRMYDLVRSDLITVIRVGRKVRIPRLVLDEWLSQSHDLEAELAKHRTPAAKAQRDKDLLNIRALSAAQKRQKKAKSA